jgi:hypothetical protein
VEFIDDGFFPRTARPAFIFPLEVGWIDDFAGTVDIERLETRGGVGDLNAVIDLKLVAEPGAGFASD